MPPLLIKTWPPATTFTTTLVSIAPYRHVMTPARVSRLVPERGVVPERFKLPLAFTVPSPFKVKVFPEVATVWVPVMPPTIRPAMVGSVFSVTV